MHFEAALNLMWAFLGLLALGSISHATFYRKLEENRRSARLHLIGLGLIVVALFPYVSATDDVLRIEHYRGHQQVTVDTNTSSSNESAQSQIDDLMHLYEVMDSPLVCRTVELSLTFAFIALIFVPAIRLIDRSAPGRAGRSPPSFR